MTVFSDTRVIRALGEFVPVAQNTAFTQYHLEQDELGKFFRVLASQAKGINAPDSDTLQGLYVFGADGRVYSAQNTNEPSEVLEMLKTSLASFRGNPPPRLALSPPRVSIQPTAPPGSVVVRTFSRIRPLPAGADRLNASVGRDFLWIRADEIASLVAGQFPSSLGRRLTRYHLLDNVRGEPDWWAAEHVRQADFQARATSSGSLLEVRVGGTFRIEAPAGRRGYGRRQLPASGFSGQLEGFILYDKMNRRVHSLKWIAEGQAWGEGTFTEKAPKGRFPLKVAFVLADDEAARTIAPQGMTNSEQPGDYLVR